MAMALLNIGNNVLKTITNFSQRDKKPPKIEKRGTSDIQEYKPFVKDVNSSFVMGTPVSFPISQWQPPLHFNSHITNIYISPSYIAPPPVILAPYKSDVRDTSTISSPPPQPYEGYNTTNIFANSPSFQVNSNITNIYNTPYSPPPTYDYRYDYDKNKTLSHTEILERHDNLLKGYNKSVKGHVKILKSHKKSVKRHSKLVAEHKEFLEEHKEILAFYRDVISFAKEKGDYHEFMYHINNFREYIHFHKKSIKHHDKYLKAHKQYLKSHKKYLIAHEEYMDICKECIEDHNDYMKNRLH